MAQIRYMFHATFMKPRGNLGLLVWHGRDITYFPVAGEARGASVRRMTRDATDIPGLVEYLEERGGGGYQTMSVPEEIDAPTLHEAARRVRDTSGIPFDVPRPAVPSCSKCGGDNDLNLVTLRYTNGPDGRILVYCRACRARMPPRRLGVTIPISDVTEERFRGLYRDGLTGSEPSTAADIVFGEGSIDVVARAEHILSSA